MKLYNKILLHSMIIHSSLCFAILILMTSSADAIFFWESEQTVKVPSYAKPIAAVNGNFEILYETVNQLTYTLNDKNKCKGLIDTLKNEILFHPDKFEIDKCLNIYFDYKIYLDSHTLSVNAYCEEYKHLEQLVISTYKQCMSSYKPECDTYKDKFNSIKPQNFIQINVDVCEDVTNQYD